MPRMNKAAAAAARRKEAARKAAKTRAAKRYGLTVEEYENLSGYDVVQLERQRKQKSKVKSDLAKSQKRYGWYEEPDIDEEPAPPPFEDEEPPEPDEDDVYDQISGMSAQELVVFMLGLMPDNVGKKQLRLLLAETPSEEYPMLAAQLYSMPEAERTGFVIRRHTANVNERRAQEQEFMKSKEFAEEVGGSVDPKSWM